MSRTGQVAASKRNRPGRRRLVAAAIAAAFPLAAWSQTQQFERVEITGSSIKRIDAETALPVQVITRDQIQKSGATNVEQLLQTVSSFSSSGGTVVSTASGATTGSISGISLHGLTSLRTLVLLNGRRIAPYGIGFVGDSVSVDVNSIPLSAIDPAGFHREFDLFGFKPYAVETFSSALGLMRQWQFDAVIVDGDGHAESLLHALPELRDRSNAPIVVVWSVSGERRQIEALQVGATEVVVKPASARLIAAKLHRLIEIGKGRPAAAAEAPRTVVRLGPMRLDPRRAAASVGDTPLALTTGEFELLLLLASRPGEFVHRDTIGRTLGSPAGAGAGRRSADMHICRIRKKLRDAGAKTLRVETVYGRGYCLRFEEAQAVEMFASRHPQWCA